MTILRVLDFDAEKDGRCSSTVENDCDRPWFATATLLSDVLHGCLGEFDRGFGEEIEGFVGDLLRDSPVSPVASRTGAVEGRTTGVGIPIARGWVW